MNAERRELRRPALIDPRDLPAELSLLAARHLDPEQYPYIVDRLYPVGATLIYGRPGGGKTTFAFQVELWLSGGADFGTAPDEPGRVLVIDYEGSAHLAIGQSKRLAPFGSLDTDYTLTAADLADENAPLWLVTQFPGATFGERMTELEKRLLDAQHAGHPFTLIRIDTMRAFIGPAPVKGGSAYDWESACLIRINKLAIAMGAAVVLIHHPNKAGEVSGSTGIAGSVTAVYQLDHAPGADTGILKCEKNRVGPEQEWPLEWDLERGMWMFSGRLTAAQAANTGVKRAVIDYLTEHGPTSGPDLRAALLAGDGIKDKTARQSMTRLKADRWIGTAPDGLWFLVAAPAADAAPGSQALPGPTRMPWGDDPGGSIGDEVNPAPAPPRARRGSCEICGETMIVIEAGQTAHPTCEPEPGTEVVTNTPAPGHANTGPAADAARAYPTETQIGNAIADFEGEDQDDEPGLCPDCGEPRTDADRHPDCTEPGTEKPPTYPAFKLLNDVIAASQMHPNMWIPPKGSPKATETNNRGLTQWDAAIKADASAEAGFRWTRPGLADEFGPAAMVVPFDRAQFYPSSCNSLPIAARGLTQHTGRLDRDPREYGDVNPASKHGNRTGIAGVALVVAPEWDDARMPHPLRRRAVPGQPMWIPTGTLEGLWDLHKLGIIPAPVVLDSWTGRRSTSLLDGFAAGIKGAREKYADDPVMTAAVKRSSSAALRMLFCTKPSRWWRPDIRAALVGEGCWRLWIVSHRAITDKGVNVAGISNTDAISFVVPAGADPDTWEPPGYKIGHDPGQIHPGHVIVHPERCDLSGIDPARITPTRYKGYVKVTGPVPVSVFVTRRGGDQHA